MNSDHKRIKIIFVSFLVVTFAGLANLATGVFPLTHSANAIDLGLADLKCFGVGVVCDNSEDNSVTDNSDNSVTVSDSFNTSISQTCGNNSASENSTAVNTGNNVTCEVSSGVPAFAPSTLSLS